MPQFPYDPNPDSTKSSRQKPGGGNEASVSDGQIPSEQKEPIKFKTPDEAIPKTRRSKSLRSKQNSASTGQFKDLGLFEDAEALLKFRDEYGKPIVWALLAAVLVWLIYTMSISGGDSVVEPTVNPLIVAADEIEQLEASSRKERVELFGKKIDLADQLIASTEDQAAVERGAELKLKSLTHWNTLNMSSDIVKPELQDLLESTSRKFINSSNKTVANYAKVGLTVIRVHKYLAAPDKKFFPEILDQFRLVSSFAVEDLLSADNLMRIASAFESGGLEDESAQLFRVINLSCSSSHNQKIAAIGTAAQLRLPTSSTLYPDLRSLLKKDREIPLQQIRALVGEHTSEQPVSSSNVESVLDFVELLVQRNAIPESKQLLDDLSKSIYLIEAGIERDAIKQKFDDSRKRIDQVGQRFSFEGLYSVEGRPVTGTSLPRKLKMVLFWSLENDKSIELINKLSAKHTEFAKRNVQIIAVANIVDDDKEKERIIKFSNGTRGIDFYTLIKGDSHSQAFASRFPVPKLPYWVLLDAKDQIRGLNMPPGIIEIPLD